MKEKQNTPRVVVIDHFDSFTYNLVVAFENLGAEVKVFRTHTDTEDIRKARPSHIVLSPGPGHPGAVSLFQKVIAEWKWHIPILGVCLGHQAICHHFGAEIVRCKRVMHGKTSMVMNTQSGIFKGLPSSFEVCRYHSLAAIDDGKTPGLKITASYSDIVMAAESIEHPNVVGVQFHPESHFTKFGPELLKNFLDLEVRQNHEKWQSHSGSN